MLFGNKVAVLSEFGATIKDPPGPEFPFFPGIEPTKIQGKKFVSMALDIQAQLDVQHAPVLTLMVKPHACLDLSTDKNVHMQAGACISCCIVTLGCTCMAAHACQHICLVCRLSVMGKSSRPGI